MNTVGDLKLRTLSLLGDDVASGVGEQVYGGQYSADALVSGIHAALDAILPWVWKRSVMTFSTDGYEFSLPSDFYQVEGITLSSTLQNNTTVLGTFSPMKTFRAGVTPSQYDDCYWILYPHGKITFSNEILSGDNAKMYYSAVWTKPTTDISVLETPEYAMTALSLYTASHCILGKAASAANIRQYNTKVDSGTPEDNPVLKVSTHFQRVFEVAVQRFPAMSRGVIE